MTIKVLNPLPGGATQVGERRAARYIKSGRATLTSDGMLKFNSVHRLNTMAAETHRHTDGGYHVASHRGIATDKQLAGVPIVKPRELTAPRGRFVPKPLFMRAADVNGTRFARP